MELSGQLNPSTASVECAWNPGFFKRCKPSTYQRENEHHVRELYESTDRNGNLIRIFMKDSREAERYSNQADLVVNFCENVTLARLESGSDPEILRPNTLMDDRKQDLYGEVGEVGLCRRARGPFGPYGLYLELQKPRYTPIDMSRDSQGPSANIDSLSLPDAERRIIYITDVTAWSILAIVATASYNQAVFLRGFVYNHLSFTTSVGVTIATGFPKYALEFHLPFYAWRKGSAPFVDSRKDDSGRSLRQVRCIDFFEEKPPGNEHSSCEEHIYQAQVSFLVAGLDNSSYVSYCFLDTYQDGPDNDESVSTYYSQSTAPRSRAMDPASGGKIPMEMVKDEWINVVTMIRQKMHPYTHGYSLSRHIQEALETNKRVEKLQRFYDWTHSTIRLLLDLIHTLSKTVDAWSEFYHTELGYFLNGHAQREAQIVSISISTTRKHVNELRNLLKELQNQESLCNNIARELELHLALEDNKSTLIQLRTGENVKAITILALLVSPPSVTAAIFSMDGDILPFAPSIWSYLLTTLVLALVLLGVLGLLIHRSWWRANRVLLNRFQVETVPFFTSRTSRRHLTAHSSPVEDIVSAYQDDVEMGDLGEAVRAESMY
ncbi:hypothetical protein JX266_006069 [Neoarthrinium moseri]|nr:hypothetical protein JX266_006069 [Neoarthrinium moseri]